MFIVFNLTSANCVVISWSKRMPCIIEEETALFCEKIKMFALSNKKNSKTVKFNFSSVTLANISNVPFDWVDWGVSK